MSRAPDVSLSLYWDTAKKRWIIVARRGGERAMRTVYVNTTCELGEVEVVRMCSAIRVEMESWLPLGE